MTGQKGKKQYKINESTAESEKTKKISKQRKNIQDNSKTKNHLLTSRGILHEDIPTIEWKTEWISNMGKELGLKEKTKAKIHIDPLRATIKNIPHGKTPSHDSIRRF